MTGHTRDDCLALDRADPLAALRDRFVLPPGLVYLDGNSLGATPVTVPAVVVDVVHEWSRQLIGGWADAGWWDLPVTVGERIAPLVGAAPGQVIACDTTTTNLYKTLSAAVSLRRDRRAIVVEETAFPTDIYVARSLAGRVGAELRLARHHGALDEVLADDVAAVVINHVDFRTAEVAEMAAVTATIHRSGALALWDLSHSAGVIPVALDECGVDFAVGCTYKYLNGGPGSPAYLYVNAQHLAEVTQPVAGWLGHADPFLMETEYRPSDTVRRFLTGTQPIVAMRALDAALDAYAGVDIHAVRAKGMQLTGLFVDLVDVRCAGLGLDVLSPRDPQRRGSQVSLRHRDAGAVFDRLVGAGLRGDLRTPDILRFGFAPLYVSFVDVWDAVEILRATLEGA